MKAVNLAEIITHSKIEGLQELNIITRVSYSFDQISY